MNLRSKKTWDTILIVLAVLLSIFLVCVTGTGCGIIPQKDKSGCDGNKKMLYHQGYSTKKMKV